MKQEEMKRINEELINEAENPVMFARSEEDEPDLFELLDLLATSLPQEDKERIDAMVGEIIVEEERRSPTALNLLTRKRHVSQRKRRRKS